LNATKLPYGTAGEIEMNTDPKRKIHKGDYDRVQRARRPLEEALDEALKNIFPASDAVSIAAPTTCQTCSDECLDMVHARRIGRWALL
jgi:hypothetical protein